MSTGGPAGISSAEITTLLSTDPALVDILTVDGHTVLPSFPLACSLSSEDVVAIALTLLGVAPESLDCMGLFQRLLSPQDSSVTAAVIAGPALLPADVYIPSSTKPAFALLQRDIWRPADK